MEEVKHHPSGQVGVKCHCVWSNSCAADIHARVTYNVTSQNVSLWNVIGFDFLIHRTAISSICELAQCCCIKCVCSINLLGTGQVAEQIWEPSADRCLTVIWWNFQKLFWFNSSCLKFTNRKGILADGPLNSHEAVWHFCWFCCTLVYIQQCMWNLFSLLVDGQEVEDCSTHSSHKDIK